MNKKVQCPNCGFYKVRYRSLALAGAGCLWLGCLPLLLFVWPLAIILFVAGVLLAVYDKNNKSSGSYFCKNCKNKWTINAKKPH